MSERLDRSGFNPSEGARPTELGIKTFGKSIPSLAHPHINEDTIGRSDEFGFALVLDGVGGYSNAATASATAARALSETLRKIPSDNLRVAKSQMDGALVYANTRVAREAIGGGTTATVAKFVAEGDKRYAVIGHVGDSRAFLFRDGKLTQITDDDSPLGRLPKPDRDRISRKLDEVSNDADVARLSADERGFFRSRHLLTTYLGRSNPRNHIYDVEVVQGDKVVLTTDGVHDNLTVTEMQRILSMKGGDPAVALASAAFARSQQAETHVRGKKDDISAVVVNVDPLPMFRQGGPTGQFRVVRRETRVQRQEQPQFDLRGGKDVQVTYQGSPVRVLLPLDYVLEVGDIRDLGVYDGTWTTDFVILNRAEYQESGHQSGYKGLRDGEAVPLGRLTEPQRFRFNPEVSRYHVEIRREGSKIVITDLNSSNGTKVVL